MTIDTNAAPGAAASTTAPDLSQQNPGAATPGDGEHTPEERAESTPLTPEQRLEKERANFQRRINRQHSRAAQDVAAAQAEARQLREQLERVQPKEQPTEGAPQQKAPTSEEIEQLAETRADQIATARQAATKANQVFDAGVKAFGADAFKESVDILQEEAGPLYQRNGLPTALGEAITDSDDAHALLHYLGENPDEAAALRGLTPAQLGRRIAKLEAQLAAAPEPKSATPLKPVTPQGSRSKSEDKMSDAEWYEAQKQRRK